MEDINLLLNYIDNEVKSKKGLFIDKKAILDYTNRIRNSLPEALTEKRINEEKQKAQNIIAVAEKRREEILNESEIVSDARKKAEEIVKNAYEMQNEYATTTMKNIYQMLNDVNDYLKVSKDSIEKAMEDLKK